MQLDIKGTLERPEDANLYAYKATIDIPSVVDDDKYDKEVPVSIQWGDGAFNYAKTGETAEHQFSELFVRQYNGVPAGATVVIPYDTRIQASRVRYNGEGEVEPKEDDGQQPTAEWYSMRTHDDLNGVLDDNDMTAPDGWDRMSMAEKRFWLDENVGA